MSEEASSGSGFRVRRFIDEGKLADDLAVSSSDLSAMMMAQASLYVYYGGLAAKASRQVDDLKMLLEVTESKVDKVIRDEASSAGTKLTEAALAKQIALHPKVIEMCKLLNEAKQIEKLCGVAVEGFKHRRDMLVQLGLMAREELKGEMQMSLREAREDEIEGAKKRLAARLTSIS